MSAPTTFLVTGANRGLGKGFTAKLLERPGVTVIAAARNPASASSLEQLPKGEGSRLITVKIDSASDTDAAAAVEQLQSKHGITSLDVVIANAGIAKSGTSVANTTPELLREHINVNAVGPLTLFQATRPLLQASKTGNPVFLPISTIIGSLGSQETLESFGLPPALSPYGASKSTLNWLIKRVHFEEPWLTSFVVHPGLVLTDMGSGAFGPGVDPKAFGAIDVETSINGLEKLLNSATRESSSGKFFQYDGAPLPW
ncbi:Norsolorinic acid ketoreductase nor1 like protein [Verticillium longisporum]|nr:Norsolorinic acid ketoreductase nor1 like protein [Verticillium longisporum]